MHGSHDEARLTPLHDSGTFNNKASTNEDIFDSKCSHRDVEMRDYASPRHRENKMQDGPSHKHRHTHTQPP
jgi:hypothetical protein